MAQKILQINYRFNVPRTTLEQGLLAEAQAMVDTPGLRWKIWMIDEADSWGGCVHLFDDDASLQAFLAGPIVAAAQQDPAIGQISAKIFDVLDEHSAITRGPI